MKSFTLTALAFFAAIALAACGNSTPMTEADMAAKYNLSMEEYEQAKEDAAAMNMTVEQHLGEGHHTPEHANHH